jgi:predicted alpha/beta hydrolase
MHTTLDNVINPGSPNMPHLVASLPRAMQDDPLQHRIHLRTQDGVVLSGTHYLGNAPSYVVIGSATGVPQGFYKRFAEFLQSHGINVVTVDYRGIGKSRQGSLRGFEMNYSDWSKHDLAAAVDYCTARGPTWLVGHSLALHAIGQLPRPNDLRGAIVYGGGAGWSGWMPKAEALRVWAMWNILGPISTRLLGYHPMSLFGIGEDLPMGVYRDWKRWCSFPHYFFDDPTARDIAAGFDRVTLPVAAGNANDDLWAMPASRDAFIKGFKNTPVERIDLTPQDLQVGSVGHMGYFRAPVGQRLWPQTLAWLRRNGLQFHVK